MRICINGICRDMTAEEIAEMQAEQRKAELVEKSRPLTESEVTNMLITAQINTLAVDDNTALRMIGFYPAWTSGTAYTVGYKVQYGGNLWRCLQDHTAQDGWQPSISTASLWVQINETHSGTVDDPIPYSGNMALVNGKYYVQDYAVYLCIRDTVNPVYNALVDLVGTYVKEE